MALKSTIFKAELQIADMDRHYYKSHSLTIAQHPSETDERMMVRLLAFALFASESLTFGKGLSDDEEPDLWQKDLTGAIQLWIDVGLPDEREIRKACGRAERVIVLPYGGNAVDIWWQQNQKQLLKLQNLTVLQLPATDQLSKLTERSMQISCTIQDGHVLLSSPLATAEISPIKLTAITD